MNKQTNLENYKKQVECYLVEKLGLTIQVARSSMKDYENTLPMYLEDKLSVAAMATLIAHGL